jgi:hypothetical protein
VAKASSMGAADGTIMATIITPEGEKNRIKDHDADCLHAVVDEDIRFAVNLDPSFLNRFHGNRPKWFLIYSFQDSLDRHAKSKRKRLASGQNVHRLLKIDNSKHCVRLASLETQQLASFFAPAAKNRKEVVFCFRPVPPPLTLGPKGPLVAPITPPSKEFLFSETGLKTLLLGWQTSDFGSTV